MPEFLTDLTGECTVTSSVQADSFLTLHYRLSTAEGEELLSTFGMSPATFQMGSGQLAQPLEACLLGLPDDAEAVFDLLPDQAFGPSNPALVERIALGALPQGLVIHENSLVEFETDDGKSFSGFLRQIEGEYGLFDFNHPLAGKTLRFEVRLLGVM